MNKLAVVVVLVVSCLAHADAKDSSDAAKKAEGEKKISEYVKSIMEHYKQEDPVGLPLVPIPDPMKIPDLSHSIAMGTLRMKNVLLSGLSKFRIHHVTVDLQEMKCEAALTMDNLLVYGNYTLSTWLSRYQGPFTVKLKDVYVQGTSELEVLQNGQLEAQAMNMDINFKHIDMNFEGLGVVANLFQGIINSVGTFVFDSIKPFILSEANTNLRKDVNEKVRQLPQNFTNTISPLDQVLIDIRKKIRDRGYDPYKIDDYNHTAGLIGVQMMNTWVTGLSSIHRVGNFTFEIRNNTLRADLGVGTQRLEGTSYWEVSLGAGMMSRTGSVAFTVEYLKVELLLSQTLDTRNSPVLEDIQLELGNIQVRCNGAGTLDYIVEYAINILPNILRYQIMDAVESPIKMRIQEELNAVNVTQLIEEKLSTLDEQQKTGFKGVL